MKIMESIVDCEADGTSLIKLWCELHTVDDIVDIIAWLRLAKRVMEDWEEIRAEEKQ